MMEDWLRAILRCPACRAELTGTVPAAGSGELRCGGCGQVYPVVEGIPVLLTKVPV